MTHGWRFLPVRVGLATRHLEEHRVATVFVEHPIRGLAQRLADAEGVGGGAGGKGASGPRSRARRARSASRRGTRHSCASGGGSTHRLNMISSRELCSAWEASMTTNARVRWRTRGVERLVRRARSGVCDRGSAVSEKKLEASFSSRVRIRSDDGVYGKRDSLAASARRSRVSDFIITTATPRGPRTARTYTPRVRLRQAR